MTAKEPKFQELSLLLEAVWSRMAWGGGLVVERMVAKRTETW